MKTIKLRYKCRWCAETFETGEEYLDNFIMSNRLHDMHCCNDNLYKQLKEIPLRYGVGDLIGYRFMEDKL